MGRGKPSTDEDEKMHNTPNEQNVVSFATGPFVKRKK